MPEPETRTTRRAGPGVRGGKTWAEAAATARISVRRVARWYVHRRWGHYGRRQVEPDGTAGASPLRCGGPGEPLWTADRHHDNGWSKAFRHQQTTLRA
ncbi:hypothetical protein GCM10009663_23820 [Kitasatospora arboriphila]|uniref:DNA-binding domain-containing protein n=1 Tax=Kitasatospora arboriphila TaxID=258052 RepID=A0ABN1TFF5_9ACTN